MDFGDFLICFEKSFFNAKNLAITNFFIVSFWIGIEIFAVAGILSTLWLQLIQLSFVLICLFLQPHLFQLLCLYFFVEILYFLQFRVKTLNLLYFQFNPIIFSWVIQFFVLWVFDFSINDVFVYLVTEIETTAWYNLTLTYFNRLFWSDLRRSLRWIKLMFLHKVLRF